MDSKNYFSFELPRLPIRPILELPAPTQHLNFPRFLTVKFELTRLK